MGFGLLRQKMRGPVIGRLPKALGLPRNISAYLERVDDTCVTDAYHSLSIEGYRITPALNERVRSGAWNPETNVEDQSREDTIAKSPEDFEPFEGLSVQVNLNYNG